MKILFSDFNMPYLLRDSNYPVGGKTIQWYSWINGFKVNKCEVGVLTWKGSKQYVGNNTDIVLIESYDPTKGIRKIRWIYYRLPIIYRAIKKYNPDVIIQACAGFETGVMSFFAKVLNVPFIYRVANDIDTDDRLKLRLNVRQRTMFKFGLKHSSAILCQNTYQYHKLRAKYNTKKLHIIHNPLYLEKTNKINKFSSRSYIAWIGIFQYQKNLPALYEIAMNLPEIEFRIAGKSTTKLDEETQEAIRGLSNCKNVKFVGYLKRDEVLPFLSQAYALLNTSHYEGFSNTFLEAMATGTPIITSQNANPDNLICERNIGVIAESYEEMDKAIVRLLNNQNYEQLSNNCRKYLLESHNPVVLSNRIINIINDILA